MALLVMLIATICILNPSRPRPQTAIHAVIVPKQTVHVHIMLSKAVIVTAPFAAIRLHASGIDLSPETIVDAAIDDRAITGVVRSISNQKPNVIDVSVRLISAGKHELSVSLWYVRAAIKYEGSGRIQFTLPEGRPIEPAPIANTSRDIIYSIDRVFDGRQIHVIAAGQPEHDAVLKFAAAQDIAVDGWGATATHALPSAVLFRVDRGPMRVASLGDDRPDVAKAFLVDALEYAGFTARFSTRSLRAGHHNADFFIVPQGGTAAERVASPLRFVMAGP